MRGYLTVASAAMGVAFWVHPAIAGEDLYGRAGIGASYAGDIKQDFTFDPDIEFLIPPAEGQSIVGSWGHGFANPDGRLGGYGMMNAPGVPLTISSR